MLLQLQKQGRAKKGISHQLNRFLQDLLNLLSPFTRDSLNTLGDSTLSFFPTRTRSSLSWSIYERMVRGEDILPDSPLCSLEVYGYDVFNRKNARSFSPAEMNSIPSNYPVRAEDEVNEHSSVGNTGRSEHKRIFR
ncbi:MAG: hypothetical protein ACLFVQ_07040 [Chitinispirillaceae bacterium]